MAEILSIVSMVSYILAIFFSVISVFLWIKFRISDVIGDLSGRTAKKSITKMRETNEKNGAKFYQTKEDDPETGLLSENRENNISISAQTGLLSNETMEIGDTDETSELETMRGKNNHRRIDKIEEIGFELIEEIIFVHTDEVTA